MRIRRVHGLVSQRPASGVLPEVLQEVSTMECSGKDASVGLEVKVTANVLVGEDDEQALRNEKTKIIKAIA